MAFGDGGMEIFHCVSVNLECVDSESAELLYQWFQICYFARRSKTLQAIAIYDEDQIV